MNRWFNPLSYLVHIYAAERLDSNAGRPSLKKEKFFPRFADSRTMNVILYVMDALRADHLSCYDYEKLTSPNIDDMASNGILMEQCFTPATWTRPVAASILSGQYPPTHGTRTRNDTFSPTVRTLAERFRHAGFETVGISSMGNVSSAVGFDRGFDQFLDLYKDDEIIASRQTSNVKKEELGQEEEIGKVALPRAKDINSSFKNWLENREGDGPFFGFIWSIEPHIPYNPPEGFREFVDPDYEGPVDGGRECLRYVETKEDITQLMGLYDGEVKYNDACVGELLEELQEAEELEETIFVIIGDHGDAFNEHGRLTHGHAPYDELLHVPCVIRHPSDEVKGRRIENQYSLIDIYPTLVQCAIGDGSGAMEDAVQGTPIAEFREGKDTNGRDFVFSETKSYDIQNTFYGIRSRQWKYIRIEKPDWDIRNVRKIVSYIRRKGLIKEIITNPNYFLSRYHYTGTEFLYDLLNDPDERENLAEERGKIRDEFDKLLENWLTECKQLSESGDANRLDLDVQTQEQLRLLGYKD